jgi:hypothetical protein
MADEIKVNVSVSVNNGYLVDRFAPGQISVTQAAIGRGGGIQIVGFAADEVIAVGDVATLGWCILRNLDTTHFVKWGPTNAGAIEPIGRLEPGEVAVFRLEPGVVLRAQADTAACKVECRIYED